MSGVKTVTQKATILIVEDEDALQTSLNDVFQSNQFATIQAKDGEEAVQLALSRHPDLILLDLMLPVLGGMVALKKIREDSWGKNVPVIILTNLSANDERLVEDMVSQAPSYYLVKSDWKIHDIVKKVKVILGS